MNESFSHDTSSPTNAQSNGKVENAVKTVQAGEEPYLALLDFQNTLEPPYIAVFGVQVMVQHVSETAQTVL